SDYPLLPVHRRFWEWVLRQVDRAGTSAQLRTQLRIVYEAVRASSNDEVGHVVPGDYIFDQIASVMVQTGVLMKEIHELIKKQDDGTPDGKMRYRLCSLIFLIGKLPREGTSDLGIRATPDVLADLLITDLKTGSAELRKRIPELLARLLALGHLMPVGAEFRIQTREGGEWDSDYRGRLQKISNDDNRVAGERTDLLRAHCFEMFKEIKLVQGKSKVARRIELHFTPDAPPTTGEAIPVWVRNGWIDDDKSVLADARKAGTSSPLISVLIPRRSAEDLKKALCSFRAASETLDARGVPSGPEGIEARTAMDTRRTLADGELKAVVREVMDGIRVFMGGGNEISAMNPVEAVRDAALAALARHFPNFNMADDPKWDNVCDRAKEGGGSALEALGYKGNAADHPVCKAVLGYLGANKKGIDIRKNFEDSPYGWSRDAVDGAILTLCLNELVEARDKSGTVLDRKQLDRTKIGICDFKPVTVLITAPQKIAIKKLFQELPVSCKPGEESAAAGEYCREMLRLAESAGGEAPLPERPNTRHIFELQGLSGNEQLFALYNQRETLAQQAVAWKARKAGIEKRLPGWKSLERLLSHSTGLAVAAEVQPQRDAILDGRALLEDPDPVPGLCKKLSDELRKTLLAARADFDNARSKAMDAVDESPDAAKIAPEMKDLFVEKCALRPAPALKVGTGDELLRELEECSPSVWKTRTDALPTRFQQLQLLIAKAIAPDAVPVKLPAATLYTEKDVDTWLAAAKDEILKVLKNGPVVI
ncbi:MAG: BREX system P-loop protein BrxC, partial [Planctomycetota bacterium]